MVRLVRSERDRWNPYPEDYEANPLIWDEDYLDRKARFKRLIAPEKVPTAVRELCVALHNQRVALGLTLDDISASTRIPKKYLEAIEAGEFESVPKGLYLRNYFRLYAVNIAWDVSLINDAFADSDPGASDALQAFLPSITNLARTVGAEHHRSDSRLPRFGEILLYFFLTRAERINVIGDLEEDFEVVAKKFGERAAKLYFYRQVSVSLMPFVGKFLARLILELLYALLMSRK